VKEETSFHQELLSGRRKYKVQQIIVIIRKGIWLYKNFAPVTLRIQAASGWPRFI